MGTHAGIYTGSIRITRDYSVYIMVLVATVVMPALGRNVLTKNDAKEDCIDVGEALDVDVPDKWTCHELCGFWGGVSLDCEFWMEDTHTCFCCPCHNISFF